MSAEQQKDIRGGVFAALGAYFTWGLFPLMFRALDGVPAATIVIHRVIWSLVFVFCFLAIKRRLPEVTAALKDVRVLGTVLLASLFLSGNWLLYVWAVEQEQVLATSFGYFINPLVNVFLGFVFLGERFSRQQWVAFLFAGLAIGVQAYSIGGVPWIALVLAFTFGIYGFIRKTVNVGSAPGLALETIVLLPFALAYLVFLLTTEGAGPHGDPVKMAWLVFTGPATAIALIMFAYAARQLRYATIGMFQYIGPSIQFLIAVFLFGEPLAPLRLLSFGLIWVSLIIFTHDSWRVSRQKERERKLAAGRPVEGVV